MPLEEYYRPGEYMPVNVETDAPVTLQTDGVMDTRTGRSGVVPMFTMSATADQLKIGEQTLPIRALQTDEKLVGFAGQIDSAIAQQIFPDAKIVSVSLESADPLPGPATAWSSLDAAVLDARPSNLDELLAAGMTVVVRSTSQPDAIQPWRQMRGGWMLGANYFPAHPALLGEDAYLPTQSWTPQMPAQLRELIVLIAVLVGCGMLATVLLPARWRLPALGAVAVISLAGILIWKHQQPTTVELRGVIAHDQWIYETSRRATAIKMPMNGVVYPVFASPASAAELHAVLDADRREITCELPAEWMMAFVRRTTSVPAAPTQSDAEQFLTLARRDYLAPGTELRIENNRIVIDRVTR